MPTRKKMNNSGKRANFIWISNSLYNAPINSGNYLENISILVVFYIVWKLDFVLVIGEFYDVTTGQCSVSLTIVEQIVIYAIYPLLGSRYQWIWSCVFDVNMGECQKTFLCLFSLMCLFLMSLYTTTKQFFRYCKY